MAHLSGTFSNASAGRLRITLRGEFWYSTVGRDAGFPAGTSNYLLKATVNGNDVPPVDRFTPVTFMELDYPGGSASWSISTSEVTHTTSGTTSYGIQNLQLILQLVKK